MTRINISDCFPLISPISDYFYRDSIHTSTMPNAKSWIYIHPLARLSPIALNYYKSSESALSSPQQITQWSQAVNEPLVLAYALRTTLYTTFSPAATTSASQDSTLATNNESEAKHKVNQKTQRQKYTCPEAEGRDEDIFFCQHCGGAKDVTPWMDDGEPNAKCIGVSH